MRNTMKTKHLETKHLALTDECESAQAAAGDALLRQPYLAPSLVQLSHEDTEGVGLPSLGDIADIYKHGAS
jgi:hypothetical protein